MKVVNAMNISIDNKNSEQHMQSMGMDISSRILHSTPSDTGKIYNRMGYKIDISGTVKDNNAYAGHGKGVEDVMREAAQKDVTLERNYMAVMSGSMSGEDFARLQKEGYQVGHTDIGMVVSIVDKIKATMAQSGQIIVGYNDDLSTEELAQITGDLSLAVSISKSFKEHNIPATQENVRNAADAFTKAMQMPPVSDGALKYMVSNHQEPTIENIYLAGYKSVANDKTQAMGYFADDLAGYYGKKAEEVDAAKLASQMEKIIDETGLTVNEETLGEARWLVESGIVLTPDSLKLLHDVGRLTYPPDPLKVMDAIAIAIAEGKKPQDASLSMDADVYQRAVQLVKDVSQITDDALCITVEKDERISLANLLKYKHGAPKREEPALPLKGENQNRFLRAKRQLEEVRLRMTAEANVRLLKSGFAIDTAPIQQVIDRLKEAEETEAVSVYATQSVAEAQQRKQIYAETLAAADDIRQMPVDTIGRYAFLQRKVTFADIHERGQALRQEYVQAGRAYETMMTVPRSDLGDSIGKAFRNVDFLLEDMGLEICEANSRAVRVLAYNRMPLTRESVALVKNADISLQRVVEKLTPANALYMVRDGVNPLLMSLEELYDYLNQIPQTQEDEVEKLGKFIYKLEKKKDITKEERDACIGVFRLIRQVEKADFQALGAVVGADQSLSLMNLLRAVRTRSVGHMDHTVDDAFKGMQAADEQNLITQQINSYYEKRIDQIYEKLEPERLLTLQFNDYTTVEELAEVCGGQIDDETENAYLRESLQTIRQAAAVSDEAISEVLEGRTVMSADHLLAADYLRSYRGTTVRRVHALAGEVDDMTSRMTSDDETFEDQLGEAVDALHESLESRESAQKSYQGYLGVAQSLLTEAAMLARTDIMDMQSIVMYMKQMQFMGDMSREENYEIPLSIGDEVTSLNLKVVHNKGEAGRVAISFYTMELSNVFAGFQITGDGVRGVIVSNSRDGLRQLKDRQEQLAGSIRESIGREVSLQYVHTNKPDPKLSPVRGDTDETVSTNDLYRLAKSFIAVMKQPAS